MARKNPFASVMGDAHSGEQPPVADYAARGASRSIISTIDELAERADLLLQGETVIELEPGRLDASFVQDRMEDDGEAFSELLEAIRVRGQDSPILVRPHPDAAGRYMIVFGHRRVRVAAALGRPVRAVVKPLADIAHVLAQGQENAVRADLSFIEKALFAARLAALQYDSDHAVILAALSIDRTTLSKMLSVASLPQEVLSAIGAAKGIGRDRWYELKMLLDKPANRERAAAVIAGDEFRAAGSDARFTMLYDRLRRSGGKQTSPARGAARRNWIAADKSVRASMQGAGKRYTLSLTAKGSDAETFGTFISERLAELYAAYRETRTNTNEGD